MDKLAPGKNNKEERLNFVRYWADYIKKEPEGDWSIQQAKLIDSQIKNSRLLKIKREDYVKLKGNFPTKEEFLKKHPELL